ncbi:hypothetical protein [Sulfidibacter corallicola]|uniref:Uncharacterized protein n=1 Tax=Sulfidibacter corallicola TaxID=2818388 RepID=A0A8A4TKJ0_SULCO|nr:hypothetical protein [Sulfidibacter corallicola]QTD50060.1 hypothetical protein J3U87_31130 [Sulfidibacter corallicola]
MDFEGCPNLDSREIRPPRAMGVHIVHVDVILPSIHQEPRKDGNQEFHYADLPRRISHDNQAPIPWLPSWIPWFLGS